MKKEFTLIELMIVVAIIAIIAAIAIPNLLESKMQANESNAVGALKNYATAQATFKKANYAQAAGLTPKQYCPTFTRLGGSTAYTKTSGALLELINGQFAQATGTSAGYQGYYFTDDVDITNWLYTFGLYADPCVYDKSGINTYCVNSKGTVFMKDLGGTASGGTGYTATDTTWAVP